ncbi:hypothetical protein M011DRAFT_332511 [Sporormia fimetaria CBS 119925]|uniref:RING-type domain-containing protein n=1 Tax=Sporormia fimetaria CBS 119925 TaxID=1340428 RepID=A0A6A6VFX9_9PLEO|nr:hypothetical protein M011DRAFT_332511 [Sporormia fimetaria CBS 119925]
MSTSNAPTTNTSYPRPRLFLTCIQFLNHLNNATPPFYTVANTNCPICWRAYTISHLDSDSTHEFPAQLPCSHVFGITCIGIWTREHNTCPVCRIELFIART